MTSLRKCKEQSAGDYRDVETDMDRGDYVDSVMSIYATVQRIYKEGAKEDAALSFVETEILRERQRASSEMMITDCKWRGGRQRAFTALIGS